MDTLAIETMSMHAGPPVDKDRQRAAATAGQFEQMFVRTLVGSLRQTASVGGDGGMFGSGPGADTFADWFDQNLAEQVSRTADVGIASQLLGDLERHGEIAMDLSAHRQRIAAERAFTTASKALATGGLDVVLH